MLEEKLGQLTRSATTALRMFGDGIKTDQEVVQFRARKRLRARCMLAAKDMQYLLLGVMGLKPQFIHDHQIFPHAPHQSKLSKPFLMAVKQSNYETLEQLLLIDRFLVYEYDDCKQTGLIWAAKRNNTEMVTFLCERLSRVNFQDIAGRTALYFAAKNNNFDMTRTLLANQADPTVVNDAGVSPYALAKLKQNPTLKNMMIKSFVLKVFRPFIKGDIKKAEKMLVQGLGEFIRMD